MTVEKHDGRRPPRPGEQGFTLLEAVMAAGLIAGACAALAQMFAMSIAGNIAARSRSMAAVLASQKMEQLRDAPWAVTPGATGVDYIDRSGTVVTEGGAMPPEALFVRRWSAETLPVSPEVLVLRVMVTTRLGGDAARLTTLRARKAP